MNLRSKQMSTGLLHSLYGVAVTAALPLVCVGMAASARGRRRFGERLGNWDLVGDVSWWLHGASVGEVQGLVPLINEIRSAESPSRVLLTATSPTGLERGGPLVDETRLLPIDAPFLVQKVLRRGQFERLVVSETELWPSLLKQVINAQVPVHFINARISDYTYRWYYFARSVFMPLLRGCSSISVPDEEQRRRFISLGVPSELIHITGHTKYDVHPRYSSDEARMGARQMLFPGVADGDFIVVLGSLREGEESVWFPALSKAWDAGIPLKVVVAPRHAERFEFFWRGIETLGKRAARWSEGESVAAGGHDVLLLDTMGLLERAYSACDLAFVGATLVDIGGHNPLEPAMYGVPVVVGPHTSVIREVVSRMRTRGGIVEIGGEQGAFDVLAQLVSNSSGLREVGESGYRVYAEHRGAAARVLAVIRASERQQPST
jgi:3-deoxy-D-manno-octulosonic-acid transferase